MMRHIPLCPVPAVVLLLAGCAIPDPPPLADATVTPPAGWRTDAGPTAPLEAWWWRQFGDPVLSEVVEAALASNIDLAIAASRVAEARAGERMVRARFFPAVHAGGDAIYGRHVSPNDDGRTAIAARPMFEASYELDLFGRVRSRADAARLSAEATVAARDAARLAVAATAASGYILLRALDERLEILRATLQAREEALRIARDRAEVGYTSRLELRQAQAEYEAAAQLVPETELAISQQEHALSLLLGTPPQAIGRGLSLRALARPAIPAGLPSDLLRRRPDIARAELQLAATDAGLAAARADFMPSINLGASVGAVFADVLDDPVGIWSIGGSVLAPIFQGGRLAAGLDAAAARRDQAAHGYRQAVLIAFREVEDNLAATRRLGEQRGHAQARRTALAEALDHARDRYQAGYSSYLEQLDAQRNLLAVELSLLGVETEQLISLVNLYQAMGGGWGGDGWGGAPDG